MADNISILIQTLLNPPSQAQIDAFSSRLKSQIGKINVGTVGGKSGIKILDETEITRYQTHMSNMLTNLKSTYGSLLKRPDISSAVNDFKTQLSGLSAGMDKGAIKDLNLGFESLNTKIKSTSGALRLTQKDTMSLGGAFKQAFEKFPIWIVASSVIMGFVHSVQEGIKFVNDLNKSMTNIQMITGMSVEGVSDLTDQYAKLSSTLHETLSNMMTASEEFLRAGNNAANTAKLLEASTVMSKIAGTSQQEAAQSMIAIMNSYKMSAEDMMSVTDKMVAIDNTSATSTRELSAAIKDTAQSAQLAGSSFDSIISYIGTVSSVSRKSADTIGNAFKTIYQRYSSIREGTGIDEFGEDISNVEKDLASIGITLRSDIGTFKNFDIVIQELGTKWKGLSAVQKSQLTQDLAGTRQREILLTLLNNMNLAYGMQKTEADSAGNAMNRYNEYAKSTEAHMNDLTNAFQLFWKSAINSETINNFLDTAKNLLIIMKDLGGIVPVVAGLIAGVLTSSIMGIIGWVQTLIVEGIALNTLMGGLPLIIGLVVTGVTALGFSLSNAGKQIEEINIAQQDFNKTLQEFNETLDVAKIQAAEQALLKLKEALNYDEAVKQIDQITQQIENLKKSKKEMEAAGTTSGNAYASTITQIAVLEDKLQSAKNNINQFNEAQKEFNESYGLAKALDYESIQVSNQKIASKLREIQANKQLFSSYQSVYNKLKEGKELTADEVALNNQLISDYPEYTRVLNDKTGALGVNLEALNSNLKAQEALAIIELNSAQETAKVEQQKTQALVDDTKKRVIAIQTEIDAIQARNKAYASLIDADDPNAAKYEKFYNKNAENINNAATLLSEANERLNKLDTTNEAWKTIIDLKPEDLLSGDGLTTSDGYTPPPDDGGSKYTPSTKQKALKALLDADKISLQYYYNELLKLEQSEYAGYSKKSVSTLEAELKSTNESIAKKAEEYLSLKVEQSSIADQIQKALTDELSISFASTEKALKSLDNELSKLGNIDTVEEQSKRSEIWTSKLKLVNDELLRIDKTLKETSGLSSAQIELLEDKKTELEILRTSLTDSLAESSQNKLDAIEAVESKIIEIVKKRYEEEAKEREKDYNKEKEDLQDSLDNYKEYIQGRIDAINKLSDAEDYNKNVQEQSEKISGIQSEIDKYSLAANSGDMDAQNRVNELLKEQADEQTNLTEMQTDRERELRKEALQDNLTNYEKYIDKQENLLDEEYDDYKENLEKITSDASLYAEAQSIMANSTFEELTNLYTTFENNFGSGMSLLGSIIEDEFIAKLKMAKSSLSDLNSLVGGKITDSTDVELEKAKERIGKLQTMWYATNDPALHTKYYEEAEALRKKYKLKYQDLRGYKASYSTGGVDAVGGLNLLHGKENAVETIFNATQGKKLFDFVNNLPQSILNVVKPNIPSFSPLASSGSMINNFAFNVSGNVDKAVASDIVEQVIKRQRIEFNKMGFFK